MHISLATFLLYITSTAAALSWLNRLNPIAQRTAVSPLGQYLRGDNWGPENPCCCDWRLCQPALQKCVKTCGSLYGEDW